MSPTCPVWPRPSSGRGAPSTTCAATGSSGVPVTWWPPSRPCAGRGRRRHSTAPTCRWTSCAAPCRRAVGCPPRGRRSCRAPCASRPTSGRCCPPGRRPRCRSWHGCTPSRRPTSSRPPTGWDAQTPGPPRDWRRSATCSRPRRRRPPSSSPQWCTANWPRWAPSRRPPVSSARAAARLTIVDRGLDPTSLSAPEVGHVELGQGAYRAALKAYAGGGAKGIATVGRALRGGHGARGARGGRCLRGGPARGRHKVSGAP